MIEPYDTHEHDGVLIEIVHDDQMTDWGPQENDNAGTIYSWTREFDGDDRIAEPEMSLNCPQCGGEGTIDGSDEPTAASYDQRTCPNCNGDGYVECDLPTYMRRNYDAVLTLPLRFSDYGSSGARLYVDDSDPNCAICFTQAELDKEWNGSVDDATKYAEARIDELDQWLQGNVWGIVIREHEGGEVKESVWGFIGEPNAEYIKSEAQSMAEGVAADIERERQLAHEWACRDVVTTTT